MDDYHRIFFDTLATICMDPDDLSEFAIDWVSDRNLFQEKFRIQICLYPHCKVLQNCPENIPLQLFCTLLENLQGKFLKIL